MLNIPKAYKILILSDLMENLFPDAIGFYLAKIITDKYYRNDFILEVKDESKLDLFKKNPKYKDIEYPAFLHPHFAAGNIHLSTMVTGILARVVYRPNWLAFF